MRHLFMIAAIFLTANIYSQTMFTGYLVNEDNQKVKDAQVNLYASNEKISTKKWSKKFDYTLEMGNQYTIEIIKEGYFTKRISISTEGGDKNAPPFLFVMELKSQTNKGSDDDFPSALIKYMKNEGAFNFDVKYAKNMKKEKNLSASRD